MPWKAKAKVDGKEVDVELDVLPEGVLSEDDFEDRFEDRFRKRAKSLERSTLEQALKDEQFRTKALSAWGIDPEKLDKGGDLSADRVKQIQEELRRTEVQPLAEKVEALTGQNTQLLTSRLKSEILQAAEAVGIRAQYRKPIGSMGGDPPIVAALANRFAFDSESGQFYERGAKEGEFQFSTKPTAKNRYRGIEESLKLFAEDKENKDYLEDVRQRGPNLAGGGGSGDVILSPLDARDHSKYQAATEQAKAAGGRVIVTE